MDSHEPNGVAAPATPSDIDDLFSELVIPFLGLVISFIKYLQIRWLFYHLVRLKRLQRLRIWWENELAASRVCAILYEEALHCTNRFRELRKMQAEGVIVNVAIDKENGEPAFRRAVLDTGAEANLVAESALEGLSLRDKRPWNKDPLDALGFDLIPKAEVLIQFRVKRKTATYSTWFAVVEETHAASYDMLLGRAFIMKNRFLTRNTAVWKLG